MNIGDLVTVIHSPYYGVKNGTRAKITKIIYDHFGKEEHLYKLDELKYKNFREHEIQPLNPLIVEAIEDDEPITVILRRHAQDEI
jgi:hypothetical protein